jgi:hypothetical protein
MNRFRLLALVTAWTVATAVAASAAPGRVKIHIHVRVTNIPLNDVTISCGTFGAGAPPRIGVRPLTHVFTAPTAPLQTIELTVPVASAAFFVGCWPSTNLPNGLNQNGTTRMVSARLPRPLPATPIVMAPMIVLGNSP